MQKKLRTQSLNIFLPDIMTGLGYVIYTHRWELMKPVRSNGGQSLPFMMEAIV
jgi:hypothetical protein